MEKMTYNISVGKASDIDTIARFQVDMALESEGTSLDIERVTAGVAAAVADENKGTYIIARDAYGNAIGSLMLTREWSDWTNRWYWWIQSVFVTKEYRGKGVYRAMYDKVKSLAKESNITQIRLYVDKTNYPAQKVYQKLGMEETHYLLYEEVIC